MRTRCFACRAPAAALALDVCVDLLSDGISAWTRACPRPLVLFFDEIDSLRGEVLVTVLRQLRAGFSRRPTGFPHAVILCGMRDVRDYKPQTS